VAEAAAAAAAAALGKATGAGCVVVTRGRRGAVLWERADDDGSSTEVGGDGFIAKPQERTSGASRSRDGESGSRDGESGSRDGGSGSRDRLWACRGFVAPQVVDTVGSGDSFLAALLVHTLNGSSVAQALEAGCRLGAYVAGMPGATPRHDADAIRALTPRKIGGDVHRDVVVQLELD